MLNLLLSHRSFHWWQVLHKSRLSCHKFGVKSRIPSPILAVTTLLRSSVYKARLQQRRLESTAAQSCWAKTQKLYGMGGQLDCYKNYLLCFYLGLFFVYFSPLKKFNIYLFEKFGFNSILATICKFKIRYNICPHWSHIKMICSSRHVFFMTQSDWKRKKQNKASQEISV